jgi:hypothetical protein
MSLTLAWAIDHIRETGRGLMVLPATNRELRDTLIELARLAVDDGTDDLDDELSTPSRSDDDEPG